MPYRRSAHWARVRAPGANVLRRGAWYPVVEANVPNRVVIDAGLRDVAVHRDLVDLRSDLPGRFSIVRRRDTDRNPAAGSRTDLGLLYGVCPVCRSRLPVRETDNLLECDACGLRGPVDWDYPC